MNATSLDGHIDVSQPRLYRDDSWGSAFARLRREDPVHFHPESPFGPYWSITRYADIMKVELDHGTYSSAQELGGIQIADQAAALPATVEAQVMRGLHWASQHGMRIDAKAAEGLAEKALGGVGQLTSAAACPGSPRWVSTTGAGEAAGSAKRGG